MARPRKCRKVCLIPKCRKFIPNSWDKKSTITLFIDEAEAIRLIDKEGLTQEETAVLMGVARTTVQQIYQDARVKIATALVDGKALVIDGGDVEVCSSFCCNNQKCYQVEDSMKNEKKRIIAIPLSSDKKTLATKFSHAPYFALYDYSSKTIEYIENCEIENRTGVSVARLICEQCVSYVLCLEMGDKVKSFFIKSGVSIKIVSDANFETVIDNIGDILNE